MQALGGQFAPSSPMLQVWKSNSAFKNMKYFISGVNTYFINEALKNPAAALNLGNLQKLFQKLNSHNTIKVLNFPRT